MERSIEIQKVLPLQHLRQMYYKKKVSTMCSPLYDCTFGAPQHGQTKRKNKNMQALFLQKDHGMLM